MPTLKVWFDGNIINPDQFIIAPNDESVLYGRGVFETTRTIRSVPWLWPAHIDRLIQSAAMIGIELRADQIPSVDDVTHFVKQCSTSDMVIRLNVGATGPTSLPKIWMLARPLSVARPFIRLAVEPQQVSRQDVWSTIKSLNYLSRHLAYERAVQTGWDDALLLAESGEILESAHGNIFAKIEGRWRTPPAGAGLLSGTVRQALLADPSLAAEESPLYRNDLASAEIVVVTNSVRGAEEVVVIEGLRDVDPRGLAEIGTAVTRLWPSPPTSA
jgi:branched-subunit amino acid aminotransferase/4-amino-4-deoxychorismate lyase